MKGIYVVWYGLWVGMLMDCSLLVWLCVKGHNLTLLQYNIVAVVGIAFFVLYAYCLIHINMEVLSADAEEERQAQESE